MDTKDTATAQGGTGASLPESVKQLGWISFFTDIASEMVYPVVPLFLVASLGAPATALGAIEGVAEAVVNIMKGLSGLSSDRNGRRIPYIKAGYGLGVLSKPLLALAFAWPLVFVARCVDRLGKGLRTTARDALVADAVDCRMAGRAYGFHRMMDTTGAILGALAALLLLHYLPASYRTIFLLAALPGAVAVGLTFRLREVRLPERGRARPPLRLAYQGLPPRYWRTLVPMALFAFANSSDAFLLLRAKNLGLSDSGVVLAYVLFNLTYAASAYPLGALSDRCGRWRMMLAGWGLYAGTYLGFASVGAGGIWWLFPVYGVYMGLTEGVGKALIAMQAPPERRGTAIGFFQMCVGIMTMAGSLAAGWLWDWLGSAAPFRFGGGMALAALLAVLVLAPWRGNTA
ncbi:MAG: MFS transporter [Desulfovibrionaceae bacterium]